MKFENKVFFKTLLFQGGLFALLMAGYDYYEEERFIVSKFLFHFFFFGLAMAFTFRYSAKKLQKKKEEEARIKDMNEKQE